MGHHHNKPLPKPFNKKPLHYEYAGGRVHRRKKMSLHQLSGDSVRAILMPGEIVIPTKHSARVTRFLRTQGIKLPGL